MIREHHLRVERTARYATVGEPGESVRELWIACHGFGQLASRFLRPFESFAAEGRMVAAPEALNRFYLDRPTEVADAARLAGAPVTLVVGEYDATVPPADVEVEARRLEAAGIPCDVVRYPGGHAVHAATLGRLVEARS